MNKLLILSVIGTGCLFIGTLAADSRSAISGPAGVLFGFAICAAIVAIAGSKASREQLERIEKLERDNELN